MTNISNVKKELLNILNFLNISTDREEIDNMSITDIKSRLSELIDIVSRKKYFFTKFR